MLGELTIDQCFRRPPKIGITSDIGCILASQLKSDSFEALTSGYCSSDRLTSSHATGESNKINSSIRQKLQRRILVGMNDLDYIGRKPGFDQSAGYPFCWEWGLRRRLDDDRISSQNGRNEDVDGT